MAVDSAGRLLITGNTDGDMFASRLNAAGVVDTGFGTGGVATPAVAGTNRGLALQPSGKILLVGQDGPGNFMVARFLP